MFCMQVREKSLSMMEGFVSTIVSQNMSALQPIVVKHVTEVC